MGTISPQAAQATPDKQKDCTICHGEGAAPGFMQPAAQETYTKLFSITVTAPATTPPVTTTEPPSPPPSPPLWWRA